MCPEDETDGMGEVSKDVVNQTNTQLSDQESAVLKRTATDLSSLSSLAGDPNYAALIAAVEASTQANENEAALKERLTALGSGVLALAKKAAEIAGKGLI